MINSFLNCASSYIHVPKNSKEPKAEITLTSDRNNQKCLSHENKKKSFV